MIVCLRVVDSSCLSVCLLVISVIIEALIRAYNDGMDILTLSLGGVNGWSESSTSVVASRIAAQGRVVTVAAGNDGPYGSWYTSSPGDGLNVISVASVDKYVWVKFFMEDMLIFNTRSLIIPSQNATVHGVQHDPIVSHQYLTILVECLNVFFT